MNQQPRRSAAAIRARTARGEPVSRPEPRHRQPAGVRRAGAGPGAEGGARHHRRRARGAFDARVFPAARRFHQAHRLQRRSQPRRRQFLGAARASRSRTASRSSSARRRSRSPEKGLEYQASAPKVPPPEELQPLDQAAAGGDSTSCRRNSGAGCEIERPFEFRPVQKYNPLAPGGLRAGAADLDARGRQTTRRRRAASLPAGVHLRLLAARHLDHAARLVVPARQPHHGEHRSRHLVSPPGARRRLAAVQPRQPEQFGRARLRARQLLFARRRRSWPAPRKRGSYVSCNRSPDRFAGAGRGVRRAPPAAPPPTTATRWRSSGPACTT